MKNDERRMKDEDAHLHDDTDGADMRILHLRASAFILSVLLNMVKLVDYFIYLSLFYGKKGVLVRPKPYICTQN